MSDPLRVTVWNEHRHERDPNHEASRVYPEGMHTVIAAALEAAGGIRPRTATLDDPDQGLGDAVLEQTDVLVYWAHCAHAEVSDAAAARVQRRVLDGMGFVVLHSACLAKPFLRLMGTSGSLIWRCIGEKERLWVVDRGHAIAAGLPDHVEIPQTEMYGEPFDIPTPDDLVFVSWFAGGEVFRSGCGWRRGRGKVFFFRPGHETYPIYRQPEIQRILANAVRWAAPASRGPVQQTRNVEPLERVGGNEE